jgi:hypothetical protein
MGHRAWTSALLVLLLATPLAAAPDGATSLKSFLHGNLIAFEGRRVVVEYDFSSPLQLLDFEPVNPFLLDTKGSWRIVGGKLVAAGTGAFRWKPVLDPDLKVRHKITPRDGRDVGVVLVEPDVTPRCIVFTVADRFLSTKDRQRTHAHMITCCGVVEAGSRNSNVFRYVDRSWKPTVTPGEELTVDLTKVEARNSMVVGGTTLEGRDVGVRLPEVQVAMFVLDGAGASWSLLRIEAVLSESWLREKGIAWDEKADSGRKPRKPTEEKPVEEGPPDEEMLRAKKWIETLGDLDAPMERREEAAQKLIERKRICDVPHVVRAGHLYSGDLTTRTLAIRVLEGVVGKNLGYNPKAGTERRKVAVGRWWAWVRQNRGKIDKDEEAGGSR